jgi:tight adherence protein B
MPAIVGLTAGLLIFMIAIILLRLSMRDKLTVSQRLAELGGENEEQRPVKVKRKKHARDPVSLAIANDLFNAGIRMRPNEFLVIWFLSAVFMPVLMAVAGLHLVSVAAVGIIGLATPPLLVRKRKKKRLVIFEKQLGEALVLICNCLRAGMTFQQAMSSIATEMPDPIAREFSRTVKEIHLGASVDTALDSMVKRVGSTDLMITISAIQIQRQVGGNLMEILENISMTIKDRIKIKEDIRVLTATGRSSGVIVGAIPLAIGGLLTLVNPAYIMTFFETRMGVIMLIVAGAMEAIGFLIIRKIVSVKY